ncbi:hypothetical protein [Bradyrhizobium sp. Tv2a-2]|uniref:hypothetical protein n=1 Tax=Bradyrhizobium sp. Tv2a-2 TaxID=113395 RepID=UPI000421C041|nr:hypothetical protein [Bradyrhizobium sp. Tv2a-2]
MRPFWTDPANSLANSPFSTAIHPALTSFADEVCATIARLFAYVGTLALIAILAVHFWGQLPQFAGDAASLPSWSVAGHSQPAFSLGASDQADKSATYTILRHPQGGRRDIFSWPGAGDRPAAELEIYRLGDEAASASLPSEDLALRMPPGGELEAAGVIDSKFGTVSLLWRGATAAGSSKGEEKGADKGKDEHRTSGCLGFFRGIDDSAMRISGWSCQGDTLPAQRGAVACMLDRLTLVSAGSEPKLAELFARAELNRLNCGAAGATASSGDWVTQADNPPLRGAL